jgi:hypothetical protein
MFVKQQAKNMHLLLAVADVSNAVFTPSVCTDVVENGYWVLGVLLPRGLLLCLLRLP